MACCDVVNRGVAIWKGFVYFGALDGRLIALDAKTGDQIFWTNNDDEAHWPGLPDDDTFFMPNQIAPGSTSSIFAPGLAETLNYVCSLHPDETGTIEVT